jgi:ribosomal protein S9
MMAEKIFIGRRKTAGARVILRSGNGKITVNDKEFEHFFPQLLSREHSAPIQGYRYLRQI